MDETASQVSYASQRIGELEQATGQIHGIISTIKEIVGQRKSAQGGDVFTRR
jgi:methyl-accepting chemotaxis protein